MGGSRHERWLRWLTDGGDKYRRVVNVGGGERDTERWDEQRKSRRQLKSEM